MPHGLRLDLRLDDPSRRQSIDDHEPLLVVLDQDPGLRERLLNLRLGKAQDLWIQESGLRVSVEEVLQVDEYFLPDVGQSGEDSLQGQNVGLGDDLPAVAPVFPNLGVPLPNLKVSPFEHKDTSVLFGTHDHPGLHAAVLFGTSHMLPHGEPATKIEIVVRHDGEPGPGTYSSIDDGTFLRQDSARDVIKKLRNSVVSLLPFRHPDREDLGDSSQRLRWCCREEAGEVPKSPRLPHGLNP